MSFIEDAETWGIGLIGDIARSLPYSSDTMAILDSIRIAEENTYAVYSALSELAVQGKLYQDQLDAYNLMRLNLYHTERGLYTRLKQYLPQALLDQIPAPEILPIVTTSTVLTSGLGAGLGAGPIVWAIAVIAVILAAAWASKIFFTARDAANAKVLEFNSEQQRQHYETYKDCVARGDSTDTCVAAANQLVPIQPMGYVPDPVGEATAGIAKILGYTLLAGALGGIGFIGYQIWKETRK